MSTLINALIEVESHGNDYAIGDKHLKNRAYGCLQIRKPCLDDVNALHGTAIEVSQLLGNRTLSIWVCERYLEHYATKARLGREPTDQDRARIWNGGPSGWKKASTLAYWKEVSAHLPMKLTLYKPITPFAISQNFAEHFNAEWTAYPAYRGHSGIDVPATSWQPVYSAHDGFVYEEETDVNRGLGLGIITPSPVHIAKGSWNPEGEYHAMTRYWHFAAYAVHKGDPVTTGHLIGWADNTGASSRNHLHFELMPMVPNGSEWVPAFYDNGFYGAIDPTPYLANLSAFEKNSFFARIHYQLIDLVNKAKPLSG